MVTIQRTLTVATTTIDHFVLVENVNDYFESAEVLELLNNHQNVLLFELQIHEISNKPNQTELNELAKKCSKNSIVLFLITKNVKRFHLFWKSNKIEHFLELKLYDSCECFNDLRMLMFIADFVASSLRFGHLGLHSAVPITKYSTKIELHLLADHRNFNLLLIASELGDLYIVNFLLDASFTAECQGMNAQTLAYNKRHFDVLLALLNANLRYPQSIEIQDCPDNIKEFANISSSLNEAMLKRDSLKVLEILNKNPQMRHFYDLCNQSAPAFALKNKLWDIYSILVSKNVVFGLYEDFSEFKKMIKKKDRKKLREIHYTESKFLPDNHMHVLVSNSRLAPGTTQHDQKYKITKNAFEILDQNPCIQIILMVVAASRNFRIVFDFNQNSVEHIDPTTDGQIQGLCYLFGRIYIAAKQLLNPNKKFEALGILAHELCHYAMNLVYKNLANPYSFSDSGTEQDFEVISRFCKENCEREDIIKVIYSGYPAQEQHLELIVRVPHLMMHYANNLQRLEEVRWIFKKLFDFFSAKTVPEMKEALSRIQAEAEAQDMKNRRKIRNLTFISILFSILAIIGIVVTFVVHILMFTCKKP
ncbi:unnamed protein product [Chironomus riparius]|uniref:Ankyrin repeat-containing protein n=1 Tax=Chironomus riparius TaxID=315576 RepID=A0A9P0JDC9_9DIPT|nr:unnamed protein product [Chironomus riparius]